MMKKVTALFLVLLLFLPAFGFAEADYAFFTVGPTGDQ